MTDRYICVYASHWYGERSCGGLFYEGEIIFLQKRKKYI